MRYPGGKGKCFQHILNIMPPHSIYVETHLGGGAVLRHKQPAHTTIGIDRDPRVIDRWRAEYPLLAKYIHGDARELLLAMQFNGDELVYSDPPYLPSTRRRRRVYKFDYTEQDHINLLNVLRDLPCRVVISGYPSRLYQEQLPGWNSLQFLAKTHNGVRIEQIWFNYEQPTELHDSSHLGADYRERELVKRRLKRVKARIGSLSIQEQFEIAKWLGASLGK
jgi:DNA adenine methylase